MEPNKRKFVGKVVGRFWAFFHDRSIIKTPSSPFKNLIEYENFGEGSHISTNQRRESTVFSLLIG